MWLGGIVSSQASWLFRLVMATVAVHQMILPMPVAYPMGWQSGSEFTTKILQ